MIRLTRIRWLSGAALLVLGVPVTWLLARTTEPSELALIVTTSGELRALKDIKISGPATMQQAQVYQVKIQSIIPEGSIVKEGDVVAELDRAPAVTKMNDVTLALQKAQAQHEQAMLDSTLNLSKAREEMRTMELSLEEKRIAKDQAKYEAPSVQRTAAIDLEKAERALAQAKVDYKTKTEQAQAKMREVGADFARQQNLLKMVQDVIAAFSIKAPAPGMVIYVKEWNGKKRTAGAQVGAWDPTVATLPDLSVMESVTYVNEIDVRKVAVGQPAAVTLDADPTKKLTGKVTSVANVGEQRPNADAKVFEVKITIDRPDTTLRPGMTTGNAVETFAIKNVLYVPLEAVINEDGIPFVFKHAGSRVIKQEIETGAMNDDEVVVVHGVEENDRLLLSPPADAEKLEAVRLPASVKTPKPPVGGDTATKTQVVPQRPPSTPSATPEKKGPAPAVKAPPPPQKG